MKEKIELMRRETRCADRKLRKKDVKTEALGSKSLRCTMQARWLLIRVQKRRNFVTAKLFQACGGIDSTDGATVCYFQGTASTNHSLRPGLNKSCSFKDLNAGCVQLMSTQSATWKEGMSQRLRWDTRPHTRRTVYL